MPVVDILKKHFEHWRIIYESPHPPSEREKVKYWGWEITFEHPLSKKKVQFMLQDAKYLYGPNFPYEYMATVKYWPYGYEGKKYERVVYGNTLKEVFEKALREYAALSAMELPPERRGIKPKQFKLSDFLYALIPIAAMFIIGRKVREYGY